MPQNPFAGPEIPKSEPSIEIPSGEIKKPSVEEGQPGSLKKARENKLKQRMKTVHTIVYQSLLQEGSERSMEERHEHDNLIETLETMSAAPFHNIQVLGEAATNEKAGVNRSMKAEVYNDKNEKITVFMKSTGGEAVYDTKGYPLVENPATGNWERIPLAAADKDFEKLMSTWTSPEYFEKYAEGMKAKYGISEEAYPAFKESLRSEIGSARLGIEPGGSTVREKVVYDQSKMLGMDIIAPTVLRELKGQMMIRGQKVEVSNLVSIQEEIKSEKTGQPGRELYREELGALLMKPKEEWKAAFGFTEEQIQNLEESLTEAGSLHWLSGQLDGHQENMQLLDTGRVKILDSGLSYSKKRGVDVKYKEIDVSGGVSRRKKMEMGDDTQIFQLIRSVPMEIMGAHKDMVLPQRVRAKMLEQYEKARDPESAEHQALAQMFKGLFPDIAVAKEELGQYLLRLAYLGNHGRPPDDAFSGQQLFQIGAMSFMNAKSGEEKQRELAKKAERKEVERISADFDALLAEDEPKAPPVPKPLPKRPPPPPPSRSSRPLAG